MSRSRGGRRNNRHGYNGPAPVATHDLTARSGSGNGHQQHLVSNGPAGRIRGSAATIASGYLQHAHSAQRNGDVILAETYFQYAEHYARTAGPSFVAAPEPIDEHDGDVAGPVMASQRRSEASAHPH